MYMYVIHDIIISNMYSLPSVFLFLFCGSLGEIVCCDVLLFVFGALCEAFSCSWIRFFNADFICALHVKM